MDNSEENPQIGAAPAQENTQGAVLAQHIVAALKDQSSALIPPHIAGNLLEFLRRVESKGMEAVAWVEAYQFVQKHVPQQPGVQFNGFNVPVPPKT